MSEVVQFTGNTTLKQSPYDVLTATEALCLDSVIVIGRTDEGKLYLAVSDNDLRDILFDLTAAEMDIKRRVALTNGGD